MGRILAKLKNSVAKRTFDWLGYGPLYRLQLEALAYRGWQLSARLQQSLDAHGHPIPWITYPAIDLLAERISPDIRVFEYGCGNSTLWWASRVAQVCSVEHDAGWHQTMGSKVPANAAVSFVALDELGSYPAQIYRDKPSSGWDVVVIDGRQRVQCVAQAIDALSASGVIVLDNSDRLEYAPALEELKRNGFKHLRLKGQAPIITHESETSIFYRDGNCLRI